VHTQGSRCQSTWLVVFSHNKQPQPSKILFQQEEEKILFTLL